MAGVGVHMHPVHPHGYAYDDGGDNGRDSGDVDDVSDTAEIVNMEVTKTLGRDEICAEKREG